MKEGVEMRQFPAAAISLALLGAAPAAAQGIEVTPNGSLPSARGAAQNFTGSVLVTPLFSATEHTHATGGHVTFEPGARTAWHTHPAGQTLIVTWGAGWVQEWGGQRREMKPGDVVRIPPGVKHWHGAAATSGMSHIAITEMVDGRNVDWMEKVGDEQYGKGP
jgi:quercetin dioxygenase-like cupin family protein